MQQLAEIVYEQDAGLARELALAAGTTVARLGLEAPPSRAPAPTPRPAAALGLDVKEVHDGLAEAAKR
jgi:hypothetical protein